MRIVFVGAVEFSRHCLEKVLENRGNVVTVLTLPRECANRHSDYADLSAVASKYRIPLYRLKSKINTPENVELIRTLRPEVLFVFGWSQIISKEILRIPRLGCLGVHPALLPHHRGRHPIIWALAEGLNMSGLTFFFMDEGVDTGDILWQKSFPITIEDDAGSVYQRIKVLATEAIQEFLPVLAAGAAPRIPQDHRLATYWRKREERDGEIDWPASTLKTYNLIRALARPYIGAHTYLGGQKLIVWRARLPHESLPPDARFLEPGTVFASTDNRFDVRTRDGYLEILEYEAVGGGVIKTGTCLGINYESSSHLCTPGR